MRTWGSVFNRWFIGLLILVGGILGKAHADTNALVPSSSSNLLSIYLVNKAQTNLADIALASTPLLADHDFVDYDTSTHEFSITAEAGARLHQEVHGLNVPFVVVANGQRIYRGEFVNSLSSYMPRGCPIVYFFDLNFSDLRGGKIQKDFGIGPAIFSPTVPAGARLISSRTAHEIARMPEFYRSTESATKLRHELSDLNLTFVVVANGQRPHQGERENLSSSSMPKGHPIVPFYDLKVQKDSRIDPGVPRASGDTIRTIVRMPDGKTNIIYEAPPPDARNDGRILAAVDRLFGTMAKQLPVGH